MVTNWFISIKNKLQCAFIQIHVMELYPAITETIPNDALSFAKQHEEISDDLQINNPNLGGG